jgi:hypothetical protein
MLDLSERTPCCKTTRVRCVSDSPIQPLVVVLLALGKLTDSATKSRGNVTRHFVDAQSCPPDVQARAKLNTTTAEGRLQRNLRWW